MSEIITDEELFEHDLYHFMEWLHILTLPPVALCDTWGNYNVAWEIVGDLKTDGVASITSPCSYLTVEQKLRVGAFLESLNAVPKSLLVSATSIAENHEAMSHPCWVAYRKSATELIQVLESAASRNRAFFGANQP